MHRGHRPAAAVSGPRTPAWRVALSMFTVIPAGSAVRSTTTRRPARSCGCPRSGCCSAGPGRASCWRPGGSTRPDPGRLLGAALAVAAVAALTGGLHLDGLADTADGLGSRRPADGALEVMRRPDIGPMGVAALVLVLLIQVAAVAAVPRPPLAAAALVLAEVTGRVSVVIATSSPAARPGGFGALVAGRTTAAARALTAGVLACAAAAAGLAAGGPGLAARGLAAVLAGLLAGALLQRTAERRLGGLTGDVFGAILQVSAATVLVVGALGG